MRQVYGCVRGIGDVNCLIWSNCKREMNGVTCLHDESFSDMAVYKRAAIKSERTRVFE